MHNPWFKRRHCPVPVPVPVVVSYLNPFAASGGDGVVFINDYNCVTVTFPDLLAVTRGLTLLFACPALPCTRICSTSSSIDVVVVVVV